MAIIGKNQAWKLSNAATEEIWTLEPFGTGFLNQLKQRAWIQGQLNTKLWYSGKKIGERDGSFIVIKTFYH